MSHVSVRPLSTDESDLLESLFALAISGTNQGIAKISATAFENRTFSGGGGGTWGSITGTLSNQLDLQSALDAKQVTLVSGTNIKTINGTTLLGSGDMVISGTSPLTTKGDIYTYAAADARLPVGTNGQLLSADSGETTGLKWITASGTGTVTEVTSVDTSVTITNGTTTPDLTVVKITVIDAGGDTTTFPMLATSATGVLAPATDAGLSYNATTNALTTTTFIGALTGIASGNALSTTTITIAGTANQITSSAGAQDLSTNRTWTLSFPADIIIPTVLTVPNTGLHLLDTNASHDLIIAPGSDLTADHTLTLTTGDADRTITLSGNPTLSDWFDQAVKAASSPTFVNLTITSFAANWTNAGRTVADLGIVTTVDINGGTIDGTIIGGASAAAGTFTTIGGTTITASTNFNGSYLTASEIVITDASKNLVSAAVATYPSLTELTYVKGLTSAAQTQITARALTAITITINGTANQITSSAGAQDLSANRTWTLSLPADVLIPTVLTVPNTGLHLLDTNASHDLIIKPGSNITADRTFTITTGDTDMIVDFTAVTDEYILAYDTATNTWRGVVNGGGVPTTITVADESADTSTFIAFFTAATGDLGPKTNAGLTFNSSTAVLTATGFAGPLTGNVTGNVSGSAATVTTAAQPAITSVGTLTTLTVDDITINGNTISSAGASTLAITPTAGQAITFDGTVTLDAGVIAGATSITSTTFIGALTGNADTASAVAVGGITGLGANVATFLATPSSANLASAVTGETGSGALMFGTSPTITTDITIPNTGLHLLDTNASHDLIIKPGSDVTADRTLTLTTGDTDMIANLTAVTDGFVLTYDTGTNSWRGEAASGSGTVTSVDAANGVETVSGSAITATGTIRGSHVKNQQTGLTYTLLTGDRGKYVTMNNALAVAVTLPIAGGTFPDGWFTFIQNIGAGTVTITPTTSTINGGATLVLVTNESAMIASDGTNYSAFLGRSAAGAGATTALNNLASVAINADLVLGTSDAFALGSTTKQWSDLFLAEGGVINWDNADATLTQTGNVVALAGADLQVATAGVGTNADSVPTLSSTSTLTNKTLTAPTINGGTIDEATISGTPDTAGELGRDTTQLALNSYDNGQLGTISRVVTTGVGTQALTNSTTSDQDFTAIYTIPANSLFTNKVYRVTVLTEETSGVSSVTRIVYLKLGSTKVYAMSAFDITNSITRSGTTIFYIFGRAAAGAAANVSTAGTLWTPSSNVNNQNTIDQPQALATNGTLAITLGLTYSGTGSTETMELQGWIVEELN